MSCRDRVAPLAPVLVIVALAAAEPACPGRPAAPPSTATAPVSAPESARSREEESISALASGVRLMEAFQHPEAEKRFARALELHPKWLPAQGDLAIAQMNQLDAESAARAESSARATLDLAPGDARAEYVLGYVLAEREGKFADALPHLRAAAAAPEADATAWFQAGRAAEEAARATEDAALKSEARASYEKALAIDAKSLEANYRLGRLLLESSDAKDQARGQQLLGEHSRLIAGRPAIQPNYLTRGALALARPWERPRAAVEAPRSITLTPGSPLPLPQQVPVVEQAGPASERFRAGLTLVDLDGDGRLDVVAPTNDPMRPSLAWWAQPAPREMAARQAVGKPGSGCSTAAAGDLDRDGDVDLFVSCSTGNHLLLREADGWKDATPPEMAMPGVGALRATLVDVDHDGDLDLHALLPLARPKRRWQGDSLEWINDGKATFHQAAASSGIAGPFASDAFLWTDFDADNVVDLVAVTDTGLSLFHGVREKPFEASALPFTMPEPGAGPPSLELETLDADGDDDPDLVVVAGSSLTVLLNDSKPGAPAFHAVSMGALSQPASAASVGDLDLDGTRELVLLAPTLPLGTTRGELASAGGIDVPLRFVGADGLDAKVLAVADVDGDGAPDVASRRREGEPVVLWNEAPGAGVTWAGLAIAGREGRSNPHGFGAKLTIDAGSLHVRFERREAQGTLANVVAPEIVGLGGRARIDGVTTLWPSGIQQGESDLDAGKVHAITEVDRQPSSCPMLYGWDGGGFAFLTDCFDTAPAGLWIGPNTHWAGDPDEVLRLRDGWVAPQDGVLNLSIAEFLNETLLADRVGVLAVDHAQGTDVVVDEGVRLAAPPQPLVAWIVSGAQPVKATQDGRDMSDALKSADDDVAGWQHALPWAGLAEPHAIELEPPSSDGILVLQGSLNFSNSLNLFAASQAGVEALPASLQRWDGSAWRDVLPDCGLPAGFHKDVVIDLRPLKLGASPRLRIATNLQVSWDRATLYASATPAPKDALRELPLLRAQKRWLGVPREVKGPQDRWRSFPRDGLRGDSPWIRQAGTVTPDGDVRDELLAKDDRIAFVRPGEEVLLAFDDAALDGPGAGRVRTHLLVTRGWVKDATPHTAQELSVLPLPKDGAELYP